MAPRSLTKVALLLVASQTGSKSCNIYMMGLFHATFLLATLLVSLVSTQSTILAEQVLSSFIYTVYGDRTPLILPQEPTLTPLGAQQLYNAGQTFRNRYIGTENGSNTLGTAILGISPYILDNEAISILTTSDQHLVASASAFMQGLYPPQVYTGNTFATDISVLANGSTVAAPLSNYRMLASYNALPSPKTS